MDAERIYREEEEEEEGKDEADDDYLLKRNIILRNYQIRIQEMARNENTIIYLPTGTGKTLIAVNVLCTRGNEIKRRFSEGGKRAFFVCITKIMVHQIGQVLRTSTKFKTGCFTGDMNVDCWNRQKWMTVFEETQVLVLTGEILKQLLELKLITPNRISLVVLDECHHAVADHPYSIILQTLTAVDPPEAPLLMGLTAVLLNSNPKSETVLPLIRSLERLFKGRIISEIELQEVFSFAANPTEKIIAYEEHSFTPLTESILRSYGSIIETFQNMLIKSSESNLIPAEGSDFKDRNKARRIKNCFIKSKSHFAELGVTGGLISTLFYIILLEKYRLLSHDESEIHALIYAKTELNKIRKSIYTAIGEEESGDSIFRHASPKVQKLIRLVKEINENTNEKHCSTIVFVQERATAVILAYMFKRLNLVDDNFSSIKADFAISASMISRESFSLGPKTEEIVKQFASRKLNLLISTNVLEEGLDVSACNAVISFDFPMSYRSYFQSRGRARDKHSTYFVFSKVSDLGDKVGELNHFKRLSEQLHKSICEDYDEAPDGEEEEQKLILPGKSGKIEINGITAIKVVYRYCTSLPQDKHALLSPIAWYEKLPNQRKKAYVQLPINSPLQGVFEGEPFENKRLAKRSAFLAVLKRLIETGELDEDLNPRSFSLLEANFDDLFPHYKNEKIDKNLPQPGTKKRKQIYKSKFADSLSSCLPDPGVRAYLHVIDLTVVFDKPELERKVVLYDILRIPVTFALVSRKKLSKIFQFPLFLDLGQINCDLLVNYDEIVLTESEFHDMKTFHFALFQRVTRVLKSCQVFDNRNKEHSFFVAPVEKNEEGRFVLNWDLIRCDFCGSSNSALVRYNPTTKRTLQTPWRSLDAVENDNTATSLVPFKAGEGRFLWGFGQNENDGKPLFCMTEADYKYFIVFPTYRKQDPPPYYIVNKLCHNMSPLSPFSNEYEDYVSYYKHKYEIEITNLKQPLLRVTALYTCSNFNTPRTRKSRRDREKYKEYEELLVPELCGVVPFDRRYWLKALLLPTLLNRICHVYCAEEFRRKIVSETGLGESEFPAWEPLRVANESVSQQQEEEEMSIVRNFEGLKSALPISKLKAKARANRKEVLDPERQMHDVGLCDLEFYVKCLEEFVQNSQEIGVQENEELIKLISAHKMPVPPLGILSADKGKSGPDLAQTVQVCTSKSANDIVDYERPEVLGDSFLKFAVSLFLFKNFPNNEGILTNLKGKIVGNRNLLYCGVAKNFPDVINVNDFVPLSDWNPPLLRVPESFAEAVIKKEVDPAVLYRLDIPPEEQFSGILSQNTLQVNEEIIENHEKRYEMPANCLLPYKTVQDKTVSDCVEAFIGVYLLTLGLPGAFDFLLWLGVLPTPKGSHAELIGKPYQPCLRSGGNDVMIMNVLAEVFYSELEDTLNYRFRNKALLLEALTHPSYIRNGATDCYQRLEFLGDAILDFLVTSHVYETCGNLSPGQLTDIRTSLVNNITFACLVVRYELHKYLLSFSSTLKRSIEDFVSFQANRNHVVDENVVILLEENDCMIADAIQVPKALGDLFESLAGAIFLDSGNSLEAVWKVYYVLMKREIDEFTKTVPKTCIRLLQEICGEKPYYESQVVGDKVKVSCYVYYENREIKAHGFGANKNEAKKSASKLVLNKILASKK